jgi:diketogulonate reductase-like aldo/keto reductase
MMPRLCSRMRSTTFGRVKEKVSAVGFGTWKLGGGWWTKDSSKDDEAIKAIVLAMELGSTFVDTAEAYGDGHSEELTAKAIGFFRKNVSADKDIFVATKVAPEHLGYEDVIRCCEASLRRLELKQVDLYQIHWPNSRIPIAETMRAFEYLVDTGKIRYIGVSNFSVDQFEEAQSSLRKYEIQSNQVSYSYFDRNPERELLGYCNKNNVTLIAYSPLGKGKVSGSDSKMRVVDELVSKYKKTRAQILLNWLLSKGNVLPIPKASKPEHIKQNCESADFQLTDEDCQLLDAGSE